MSGQTKFKKTMSTEDALQFLEGLLHNLRGEAGEEGRTTVGSARDLLKLRIRLKRDQASDEVSVKFSVKLASPGEPPREASPRDFPGVPRPFAEIKQRMKESFKVIFKALASDGFPPEEAVEAFMRDGKLMCVHPGYGEEHYAEFAGTCETFARAFRARDLPGCQAAVRELNRMKTECHSDHK